MMRISALHDRLRQSGYVVASHSLLAMVLRDLGVRITNDMQLTNAQISALMERGVLKHRGGGGGGGYENRRANRASNIRTAVEALAVPGTAVASNTSSRPVVGRAATNARQRAAA